MSPRAAARLESLGFTDVYDYVPGKADWAAAGLPTEGEGTKEPTVADAASKNEVTCRLTDRVGDVARRVTDAGKSMAIVTTDAGVVLGRLKSRALEDKRDQTAEESMEAGPTTIRGNSPLESTLERLRSKNVGSILVTTAEGKLIGTLYREEAERQLAAYGEEEEGSCCCPMAE